MSIEPVDAAALGREVVERFRAQASRRNVALETDLAPGLLARADRARLGQIVDNYLSNAVRYSPDDSSVTLRGRRRGSSVELAVHDHGPGLTADQRARVFERFYRVDPSRSRALGGSGIGLAISRALAQAMDGTVRAESEGPGQGSTFFVELPAA